MKRKFTDAFVNKWWRENMVDAEKDYYTSDNWIRYGGTAGACCQANVGCLQMPHHTYRRQDQDGTTGDDSVTIQRGGLHHGGR